MIPTIDEMYRALDEIKKVLDNTNDGERGMLSAIQEIHELSELDQPKASTPAPDADLLAEIARLQAALNFWLPRVPEDDPEIAERAGNDAFLLTCFDGPSEKSAEERGWITLRGKKGASDAD